MESLFSPGSDGAERTRKLVLLIAFCVITNFASLHTYMKLLPNHKFAGALLAVVANLFLTVAVVRLANKNWMQSKILFSALILFFFAEVWIMYPIADALKLVGKGSDQDDAMIMSVDQIRAFHYPYTNLTYLGDRISPGPGWVLLHVPLTALGLYQFIGPLMIAVSAWYLRRTSKQAGTLFLTLLFISPTLHNLLVPGSDLIALATAVMLFCFVSNQKSALAGGLWAVLLGFISTARVNFISLPFAFLFIRPDRISKRAIWETMLAVVVGMILHLGFYLAWPDHYAPIHLLLGSRGLLAEVPYLMPIAIVSTVSYLLIAKVRTDIDRLEAIGWYLFAMHLPVAMGLLKLKGFNFAIWDGFEYMFMALPCFAAAISLLYCNPQEIVEPIATVPVEGNNTTPAYAQM